jgi:hypothetical protein
MIHATATAPAFCDLQELGHVVVAVWDLEQIGEIFKLAMVEREVAAVEDHGEAPSQQLLHMQAPARATGEDQRRIASVSDGEIGDQGFDCGRLGSVHIVDDDLGRKSRSVEYRTELRRCRTGSNADVTAALDVMNVLAKERRLPRSDGTANEANRQINASGHCPEKAAAHDLYR